MAFVDLKIGDLLMDYITEHGTTTDQLAIGFVVSKKYYKNNTGMYYVIHWSDCGEEDYSVDHNNLSAWRRRFIDYEKSNRLDNE